MLRDRNDCWLLPRTGLNPFFQYRCERLRVAVNRNWRHPKRIVPAHTLEQHRTLWMSRHNHAGAADAQVSGDEFAAEQSLPCQWRQKSSIKIAARRAAGAMAGGAIHVEIGTDAGCE